MQDGRLSSGNLSQGLPDPISINHIPSDIPLTSLKNNLSDNRVSCSVYELIRLYTKCWKALPDTAKSGRRSEYDGLIETTSRLVKSSYTSILDLLPEDNEKSAIIDGNSAKLLSRRNLSRFVRTFRLPDPRSKAERLIVAVAVPNGPLAGLLSIAVAAHYTLAPLNVTSNADQFLADLLCVSAKVVLVLQTDVVRLGLDDGWTSEHNIQVCIVSPSPDMTCSISGFNLNAQSASVYKRPNGPDDTCLMLLTSGTTGTRKIVPITLHSIISGVAFVGESWRLTDEDICLNMMPLNHVGGLIRNLIAPILLGGSTICCSAFDPNLFWDLVGECSPTWYYASPSMHSAILEAAPSPNTSLDRSRIRMVCNAAGGLLPSLALQLRDTFQCPVLPSYGMTECMPISTPPLDYKLDRPGTSGISIGPELAILDATGRRKRNRRVGKICVRGNPLFSGYLVDGRIDKSAFMADGWFDTGDLGYLDDEGYLFITGRSKEVINRGGEIISPFEIEEAVMMAAKREGSPIYGRVSESLAFSVPHETLQESVGIVLVTPPGKPRVDLRQLQEALRVSLHSTKCPVAVVYMEAVPTRYGKLCRVALGDRLRFPSLRGDSKMVESHFTASSVTPDAPISAQIPMRPCQMHQERAVDAIKSWCLYQADVLMRPSPATGLLDAIIAPKSLLSHLPCADSEKLKFDLRQTLHGYLIPGKVTILEVPFPRDHFGSIDQTSLDSVLNPKIRTPSWSCLHPLESRIRQIYSTLVAIAPEDIPADADFFELGGNSLKAGRLLHTLRKEFNVRIPIDKLFASSRIIDICNFIDEWRIVTTKEETVSSISAPLPGCIETFSSTRASVLLIHLLPLAVFVPLKKVSFWVVFLKTWSLILNQWPQTDDSGHLIYLVVSMFAARAVLGIILPLVSIFAKWTLVGRYKEGLYPMWSAYHNRWWLVQKIMHTYGMGIFKHFNWSRVLFYRLLGAKIGKGVRIQPGTVLGEYDLLDLGDNVELDRCICRPFAVERNTSMYLGKIQMGRNSAAGLKTVIAPGTCLPEDVCLGVNSSSWEWKDASGSNYDQLASRIPEPHWLLWTIAGLPVIWAVNLFSLLPWFYALRGLQTSHQSTQGIDTMLYLVSWFANPVRVGYHFFARISYALFTPILYLAVVVVLKVSTDALFGSVQPGPAGQRSHLDRFRMMLLSRLIPTGDITQVSSFFGTHYEITSVIIRALGGKVGKRVYWPGTGPSIQNFDLIDIGNDVVFGSRSHLITSDGIGSDFIRIGDGAMVADRVIMLPGCSVGEQAVLGSGALSQRSTTFAPYSTWIGNKAGGPLCLNTPCPSSASSIRSGCSTPIPRPYASSSSDDSDKDGSMEAENLLTEKSTASLDNYLSSDALSILLRNTSVPPTPKSTITPFGRAFYEKGASYHVYGMFLITCYSVLTNISISIYWNVPTVLSLQVLYKIANHSWFSSIFSASIYRPLFIFITLFISFSILQIVFSVLALAISIGAKWTLIGQREQGDYDWDKSSYCQRWQLLLTIERIRRKNGGGEDVLTLLTGTHYFVQFYRLLGAKIGKDCALFAGGEVATAFTEPDLLTLGDRVTVDDASLVAHINSRGNFKLNPLVVGDHCVLRTGSRLLSGASMGDDACLLEHTLVMAGDEIESGATYQGWPGDVFREARIKIEDANGDEQSKLAVENEETSPFPRGRWFSWDVRRWFRKGGRYQRIGNVSESWPLT